MVGARGEEAPPRLLELHESISDPGSEHDAIYVGGAVWAVKWVPLPGSSICPSATRDDSSTLENKESTDNSANKAQTQLKARTARAAEGDFDSCQSNTGEASRREEYLLTVSHSKGSQPELMQMNKAGIVLMEEQLSKGSLSLWAVQLEHTGAVEESRNEDSENSKSEFSFFIFINSYKWLG